MRVACYGYQHEHRPRTGRKIADRLIQEFRIKARIQFLSTLLVGLFKRLKMNFLFTFLDGLPDSNRFHPTYQSFRVCQFFEILKNFHIRILKDIMRFVFII
jgi:hypothetical protein